MCINFTKLDNALTYIYTFIIMHVKYDIFRNVDVSLDGLFSKEEQ